MLIRLSGSPWFCVILFPRHPCVGIVTGRTVHCSVLSEPAGRLAVTAVEPRAQATGRRAPNGSFPRAGRPVLDDREPSPSRGPRRASARAGVEAGRRLVGAHAPLEHRLPDRRLEPAAIVVDRVDQPASLDDRFDRPRWVHLHALSTRSPSISSRSSRRPRKAWSGSIRASIASPSLRAGRRIVRVNLSYRRGDRTSVRSAVPDAAARAWVRW